MFFLCRRYWWDNISQIKTLCSIIEEAPNNIAQVKTICTVVLEAPDNNARENVLFNVILRTTMHRSKLYIMLSERLQTTVNKKNSFKKTVLILLGQHCTGQNPMQRCPRCSRQHCIREKPV